MIFDKRRRARVGDGSRAQCGLRTASSYFRREACYDTRKVRIALSSTSARNATAKSRSS